MKKVNAQIKKRTRCELAFIVLAEWAALIKLIQSINYTIYTLLYILQNIDYIANFEVLLGLDFMQACSIDRINKRGLKLAFNLDR